MTVDPPVATVGLCATICELAGAEVSGGTPGQSLVPTLSSLRSLREGDIFIEHKDDCIVRGDLKAVLPKGRDEITRCFDLLRDPYELNDLADSLDAEVRRSMIEAVNAWRSRIR